MARTISCSHCGCRSDDIPGTKGELKYIRVIDASAYKVSDGRKHFFCSQSCYLDHQFLKNVLRSAGEPWTGAQSWRLDPTLKVIHNVNPDTHPRLAEASEYMSEHYDEIVKEYLLSPGVVAWQERMGLTSIPTAPTAKWEDA